MYLFLYCNHILFLLRLLGIFLLIFVALSVTYSCMLLPSLLVSLQIYSKILVINFSLLRFSITSLLDFFVNRSCISYTLPLSSSSTSNLFENACKLFCYFNILTFYLLFVNIFFLRWIYHQNCITSSCFDQVLDRLVLVRSIHYCTSTPSLSTTWSPWDLTSLEWEILS